MIPTRIIAALMAPSAGLLTIVGALHQLYTNPGRTQTYPSRDLHIGSNSLFWAFLDMQKT